MLAGNSTSASIQTPHTHTKHNFKTIFTKMSFVYPLLLTVDCPVCWWWWWCLMNRPQLEVQEGCLCQPKSGLVYLHSC